MMAIPLEAIMLWRLAARPIVEFKQSPPACLFRPRALLAARAKKVRPFPLRRRAPAK
jgi:hypothetical protein